MVSQARNLGRALESTIAQSSRDSAEHEAAASILHSLASLGWQPQQGSRFTLWRKLAARAQDPLVRLYIWSRALADSEDAGNQKFASKALELVKKELEA